MVGLRFHRHVQLEALAVDFDERFVEGYLVGISATAWFEIRLLNPIVDG